MNCTTHHHACACREAKFARIEADRDKWKRMYETVVVKDEGMELYAEIDRLRSLLEEVARVANLRHGGRGER